MSNPNSIPPARTSVRKALDREDLLVRFAALEERVQELEAERERHILLNLVGNAIKFTPEGGWVILSCAVDDDCVHIRVRDDGVGIPEDQHEHIFDPFQQVDRRLNQAQEGVGLGLAISRDPAGS